ncbi:MAG: hypothetical protein B6242_02970 [Anaerolineaceae bacterium 4572_78]|nr:MAG: hypothetical protein B6242_02970 [Anaerolineaceae bacterium 4572_78]
MGYSVLIHISGSDAVLADVDELPDPAAQFITCTNPRMKDGSAISYIDRFATLFLFPWSLITFVEIFPSEDEQEDVEAFFRE